MTKLPRTLAGEWRALRLAVAFMTRLPVFFERGKLDMRPAVRYFPAAGLVVGLAGAALAWALVGLDLPLLPAALLVVFFQVWFIRGLHEDGLADFADGLGGGWTAEKRLEIMKDSRIGTFGAAALFGALALRAALLAALLQHSLSLGAAGLVLAASLSRFSALGLMLALPPARAEGMGGTMRLTDRPGQDLAVAAALPVILMLALLPFGDAFLVILGLAVVTLLFAWKAWRALGGQTGDVLGAQQQIAEVATLLLLTVLAS